MKKLFLVVFLFFLITPTPVQAVIPPDFIFNIGSQVLQLFSAIIIFFSAIFGLCYEFLKTKINMLKHKKALVFVICLSIIFVASGSSYYFARLKQEIEYKKWLIESEPYATIEEKIQEEQKDITPEIVVSSTEPIPTQTSSTPEVLLPISNLNFFEDNKATPLSISNENFKNVLQGDKNSFVILDARENIEYENGYFPGSNHIRFADLRAGEWAQLPKDKVIYIFCWSGIRGKEVAEFLRTKNIVGVYLETGANGWYEFGGTWEGNIKFAQKYTDLKFQKVFTTEEVKKYVKEGVVLVDSREPAKFQRSHIKGSLSIPILFTPSADLEKTFAQVPVGKKVITICDEYVNCFDAKLTGVELEKRGYTFLGRYNKPWEYGQ